MRSSYTRPPVEPTRSEQSSPVELADDGAVGRHVIVVLSSAGLAEALDDLERRLDVALDVGPRAIVIDMSAIEQVSSTTIAALLWARRRCSSRGVEILLRHPSRRCRDTLERMGLMGMVAVVPTDDASGLRSRIPFAAPASGPLGVGSVPGSASADATPTTPGVTRFDLLCHPEVVESVLALTRRWAEDRALSYAARERLATLTRAAMAHGLQFDPRRVTLLVRWLDLDRVRLELKWFGCSGAARPGTASSDVTATIATLDALSDEWGVGRRGDGWLHWIVADTT
jgi:anti-anti-sigma factor